MKNSKDYYNLLKDTLRSSYHQVSQIYKKIPQAFNEHKYINIRTGYLMQKREKNNNYFYNKHERYPLCWNFPCGGLADYRVIWHIFDTYAMLLDNYDKNQDEGKVKQLIEEEIQKAKAEVLKNDGKKDDNSLNFILYDDKGDYGEISSESEEDNSGSLNDFICKEEEEEEEEEDNNECLIEEDKEVEDEEINEYEQEKKELDDSIEEQPEWKKKILGKKRLVDIDDNKLEENKDDEFFNSGIKKKRIIEDDD